MHPETSFVKVENIAGCVSRQDILALFNRLIGDVRKCEQFSEGLNSRMELAFNTPDAVKKALCMSGYNVAGVPLLVTAIPASNVSSQHKPPASDMRRNLYVLGLPMDLMKSDFISTFARFGKVSHCVILATVDNASRRRGFVVMSTHEEAKSALVGLSGTDINGNTIDVSWAVVQRSRGFLDGGDRTTMLASRANSSHLTSSDGDSSITGSFSSSTASSNNTSTSSITSLPSATTSLLVTNLPALLFSEASDLFPLLRPFGSIQAMQVLGSEPDSNFLSVVVEYKTLAETQEAKASLQGQLYAGFSLQVEYAQTGASVERATRGKTFFSDSGNRKCAPPLNPLAAPFVVGSHHDIFTAGFHANLNTGVFCPHVSELKPYHQVDIHPPELPATSQAQYNGPYLHQRQYPTRAKPAHPFSHPDGYYSKRFNNGLSLGFLSKPTR